MNLEEGGERKGRPETVQPFVGHHAILFGCPSMALIWQKGLLQANGSIETKVHYGPKMSQQT